MPEIVFGRGTCIEGTTDVQTCIPKELLDAWWRHDAEVESDFTLGELFRHALIDFLRDLGKLPKPYV